MYMLASRVMENLVAFAKRDLAAAYDANANISSLV